MEAVHPGYVAESAVGIRLASPLGVPRTEIPSWLARVAYQLWLQYLAVEFYSQLAKFMLEAAILDADLCDLQYVWELIKSMQFKFFKQVVQAKRQEGDDGALGAFTIAYSDNTERAPLKRSIGMEMVASDPPVGYSARTDLITLSAITHSERPCVFVEFSSDFSSDATTAVLEDSKFKKREPLSGLYVLVSVA
eukprot:Skav228833  [mRNA]  locus=scaffold2510:36077:46331:- [translate_table: standard]